MSFIRKIKKGSRIYLAEVENKRINGKVIQHHIQYIGKEADNKTILSTSISDVSIDKVKLYGPLLVLHHLASEIKLSSILGKFGDEILSLVYAHCLDYRSIKQMPQWFERTDLNMLLDLEGLTESRLVDALDYLKPQELSRLQKEIFDSVKVRYNLSSKGIIYDVTNTYLYGKKCPFGKLGKDKEGVKGRPLIQIGLGVTKEEGVPLFHKIFDGNIHDSRTLQDVITTFQDYNIEEGLIIFDRGIGSKNNYNYIKALEWNVLCGLPLNSPLKKIIRDINAKDSVLQYTNRVRLKKAVFYVVTRNYTIGEVKGTVAVCFNERLKRNLKESRYDEVVNAEKLLAEGKSIKSELTRYFDKHGKLLPKKLEAAEEFDGYACIFTTDVLSKEEMVRVYFDKDLIEKAFQSLKGVIKVQPIRHWLYNRVIAHVFICYLAYLLLSLLKLRLKKIEMSPVEALRELDSLYKVYMRDEKKNFKVSRLVALTKKQEKILRTIDEMLMALV
jgi:transposase